MILLVEDDPVDAALAAAVIADVLPGEDVCQVDNMGAAAAVLAEHHVRLVITDYQLSYRETGTDVVMAAAESGVPAVLWTYMGGLRSGLATGGAPVVLKDADGGALRRFLVGLEPR